MPVTDKYSPYRAVLQWSSSVSGEDYVTANLPEQWSLDFSSNWDAPWAQGVISNDAAKLALRSMGLSTTTKELTSQVWQSSEPVNVTIPFIFVARESAYDDVIVPCYKLSGLTLPTEGSSGLLNAPGPNVDIVTTENFYRLDINGGERISLHIGSNIVLSSVVVTTVNVEFDTMLDIHGYPVKAKADVTIRTHTTPMRNAPEFASMFGIRGK